MTWVMQGLTALTVWMSPLLLCLAGALMLVEKRPYFDAFVEGAKEGLATAVRLCPTLTALLVAIGMLQACGAIELIGRWLSPLFETVGVPRELLPLLLIRPFSGSAATVTYTALLKNAGADSFASLAASVIMGSSDTAVYVTSLYFSSVGVRKTRYALPVALFLMVFCVFFSCFVCRVCLNG